MFMSLEKVKEYLKYIRENLVNGYSDDKSALNSKFNKMLLDKQQRNAENLEESFKHYNVILKKYSELASELELENSLEICVLFTYLLWNGYFSITKQNIYTSDGIRNIYGAHCFDIMNGKGVCINFSDMLKDFLIVCGYKSANLINVNDKNLKASYIPKITRKKFNNNNSNKKSKENLFLALKKYKYGTHMFTLVQEGKYLYAYDPTNFLLLDIQNINVAKLVNGKGTFKLKPYISYATNLPLESRRLLKNFYTTEKFLNPYNKEYFKELFDELVNHLDKNKNVLDIYYNSIKENIRFISNSLDAYEEIKTK